MAEPLRSQSALQIRPSNIQVRANKIIQKVSYFRGRIRFTRKSKDDRDTEGPYSRQTRSMDIGVKPYMSQPMLGLSNVPGSCDPMDGDDSSQSVSPSTSPSRGKSRQPPPNGSSPAMTRLPRPSIPAALTPGMPVVATLVDQGESIDGLPSVFDGPSYFGARPLHPSRKLTPPDIVVSSPSITPKPTIIERPSAVSNVSQINELPGVTGRVITSRQSRTTLTETTSTPQIQSKPRIREDSLTSLKTSPHLSTPALASDSILPSPSAAATTSTPTLPTNTRAQILTSTPITDPSTPARRKAAPHLNGLPHRFSVNLTDNATARFSPSIITRQPPILRLPTLPTFLPLSSPSDPKTAAGSRATRARSLRSMPALPRQGVDGPRDGDDDDDEGEGGDLEEGEEGEDEEFIDASEGEDDNDGIPRSSMSSDNSAIPTPSDESSRSLAGSPTFQSGIDSQRQTHPFHFLPAVDTSRIDLSFLDNPPDTKGKGKGKGKEREKERGREPDATPTTSTRRHPAHTFDYFSSQPPAAPAAATPGPSARNVSQSPARTPRPGDTYSTPRFSFVSGSDAISIPKGSTPRPVIYKHASRSMIDILNIGKRDMAEDMDAGLGVRLEGEIRRKDTVKGKERANPESGSTLTDPDAAAESEAKVHPSHPETTAQQKRLSAAPEYDGVLRRRRSMPTFTGAAPPPPYPSFAPHYPHPMRRDIVIQPRDDELEGNERLPPYTNDIYIKGIMPRKMEFTSPGVQAKDRKWRRVMCVLEGTAFKVYSCPAGTAGVGVIGGWWEKKVGVGDVSALPTSGGGSASGAPRIEALRRREQMETERVRKVEDDGTQTQLRVPSPSSRSLAQVEAEAQSRQPSPQPASRSRLNLAVNLLKPGRAHGRSHSDVFNPPKPRPTPRSSLSIPRPSISSSIDNSRSGSTSPSNSYNHSPPLTPSTSNQSMALSVPSSASSAPTSNPPTSAASSSSRSHFRARSQTSGSDPLRKNTLPDPHPDDLLKKYTLQHAESGLGNDYMKRKNVIRVRMEGEQFLLQAKDVADVVEWIEGFHAATNIALDLDERVMPKGPLFPRRRRRRPRRTETAEASSPPPDARVAITT